MLPINTPLDEACLKGLVTKVFSETLTPSEITQFRLYLVADLGSFIQCPWINTTGPLSQGIEHIDTNSTPLTEAGLKFAFHEGCPDCWCKLFHTVNPLTVNPTAGYTIHQLMQLMHNYVHALKEHIALPQVSQQQATSSSSHCHPWMKQIMHCATHVLVIPIANFTILVMVQAKHMLVIEEDLLVNQILP